MLEPPGDVLAAKGAPRVVVDGEIAAFDAAHMLRATAGSFGHH